MKKVLIVFMSAFTTLSCATSIKSQIKEEQPKYNVVLQDGDFEIS